MKIYAVSFVPREGSKPETCYFRHKKTAERALKKWDVPYINRYGREMHTAFLTSIDTVDN